MHRRSDGAIGNGQMRPRHARWIVIPLLLALPSLAACASPNTPDSLRVSSTNTYAAGTPEWRQVRDWLAQHRTRSDGVRMGNLDQLGPIVLSYTRALPPASERLPAPVPLPANGATSDSIAITSCSDNVRQSWRYGVEARPEGAWVLTSFATSQAEDCKQADNTH
ncbi:hypothetical protein [Xanthomonas sp. CFBP 8445]|uniref:hypothetical protein n=1 Tax=Xanthomonas sp. CFBP 8445 TaxID=2971236 RepID=UPI0021E0A88B|nr:hypothetical protein [Xanthomonas sp. CFBP 8445]UYC12717.1 hypothetical protein NUG21_02950 [Xanthomonas sp. CFBP 8445]